MSNTIDLDDFIPTKEAATLLRKKPNTLEIWRHQGKGPPFVKLGDSPQSPVLYLRSDVIAWAAQRTFTSTSAVSVNAARMAQVRVTAHGPTPIARSGPRPAVSQPRDAS